MSPPQYWQGTITTSLTSGFSNSSFTSSKPLSHCLAYLDIRSHTTFMQEASQKKPSAPQRQSMLPPQTSNLPCTRRFPQSTRVQKGISIYHVTYIVSIEGRT